MYKTVWQDYAVGENIGKFGELSAIYQILLPIFRAVLIISVYT